MKAYPNAIAGMKDSSGDWSNTKTFLDAFAESGFDVFVGSESSFSQIFSMAVRARFPQLQT